MKMKTAELTGKALDWMVAKCEGGTDLETDGITWRFELESRTKVLSDCWGPAMSWHPSSGWRLGGPIIERERISVDWAHRMEWEARLYVPDEEPWVFDGPTPLIAAMRCYVASKLGEEVDVPEGLLE